MSIPYQYKSFASVKPKKKIVVLYHSECNDGFGGAWAAWKKFKASADYIPAQHQVPPSPHLKNKKLYLIDFTFRGKELTKLIARNQSVTIIDHHISAKKDILMAPQYSFDLRRSGAVLAWKFFHPKKTTPRLLRHIEDMDLWKFRLPATKEIIAAFDVANDFQSFKNFSNSARDIENPKRRALYISRGKAITDYQKQIVARIAKTADKARFSGRSAGVVNSETLKSEIGHALVKSGFPVGIIWSMRKKRIFVSLRSSGAVDVSKLAARHGGGGHRAAAGFSFPASKKFPWRVV